MEQKPPIEGEHHQSSTPEEISEDMNATEGERSAVPSIQEKSQPDEPKRSYIAHNVFLSQPNSEQQSWWW